MVLAIRLELQVIAEGVETEDQAQLLKSLDCTHAQGFHYARPLPPGELAQLLAAERFGELAT